MLWINKHKRVWRVAILALLLVAIMGPWAYDRINVPSEYSCSTPHIRLEGDFCGSPMSGIYFFSGFINASVALVTGAMGFTEWARGFLGSLSLFLLLLPFFSTMLLILGGDLRRRQMFHVTAWGVASGILLIGISRGPKLFWELWGIWLYIGLAASALLLEVLVLVVGRNLSQR